VPAQTLSLLHNIRQQHRVVWKPHWHLACVVVLRAAAGT
jgi:hypothetical protein